ncbi:MAG: TrkH family potassium uptake protein [Paracoccaceae bacterium]
MRMFQPVGHIIGRLSLALGLAMLPPALADWVDGAPSWLGIAVAALITVAGGGALAVLTAGDRSQGLDRRQAILLTVLVWVVLPIFGALPFMLGAPGANFTNAFFEAMSGLTTTGATTFEGLDGAPRGMLLWRAMLQWFGGVGIVVFAMVFLPALKIGGMQFFRSEGFDVAGDIVPRAVEISGQLGVIYLVLTVGCVMGYTIAGMTTFDAICHAMTTVSTGGMGNYDSGFDRFSPTAHYIAVLFMWLSAWPFIRFIQLGRGRAMPLVKDSQIRAFVAILLSATAAMVVWLVVHDQQAPADAIREALFNASSVMTGTGYATDDYSTWGGFPVALFVLLALIGGCTGSTACSAKVFRYQILFAALRIQIQRIHSPHGVYALRYQGRPVDAEVLSSVMGYFLVFVGALVVWAILLSATGMDTISSISGAIASLANLGPGLGPEIGPGGNYVNVDPAAKWILAAGMLLGRLEFMSVLVLLTPLFWRK